MVLRSWTTTAQGYAAHLLTTGKSPGTVRTYTSDVRLFWQWCAAREGSPWDATRSTVREWFAARILDVSPSRAIGTLAALHAFYQWGRDEGWVERDPCEGLKAKRGSRQPTKPVERSDFQSMLKFCSNERDRALLMLMAHTGLRVTEVATLTPESFDWHRRLIKVRGKGDKEAYVAAPEEVLGILRGMMGFFPVPGEGIWRSEQKRRPMKAHQLRKILYRLADQAGTSVHPHQMRVMFAVEHYKEYHDIERLRKAMRHADVSTTQGYIAHLEDEPVFEQVRNLWLA